ncbi:MAG: hypothetical protein ACM31L_10975 [Actinomycetota bacterium]
MSVRRTITCCLLVAGLASCAAPVPWMHPQLPKERWDKDYGECRRWADREVGWRDEDDAPDNPFRAMDRADARKRFNAYVAACMRDRGYLPASRKD